MAMNDENWEEDPRFKQCNREFFVTLILFSFNIVLLIGLSVFFGHGVSGEEMPMVFGLPAWFFWGGIAASIIFCIASILMVILFFKDMSLEARDDNYQD